MSVGKRFREARKSATCRKGKIGWVSARGLLCGLALLGAVAAHSTLGTAIVEGQSMYPTLKPGEYLLVTKQPGLAGGIREGDIVVVLPEEGATPIVKRVFKVAGETVPYYLAPDEYFLHRDKRYVVPAGNIYLLGDNRTHSVDSRVFGAVPVERVLGKVVGH